MVDIFMDIGRYYPTIYDYVRLLYIAEIDYQLIEAEVASHG